MYKNGLALINGRNEYSDTSMLVSVKDDCFYLVTPSFSWLQKQHCGTYFLFTKK